MPVSRCQLLAERGAELRMRIDAGAHRGSALRQSAAAAAPRRAAAPAPCSICVRQPRQFLAQGHRHRIHQMRAAGLDDAAQLRLLARAAPRQVLQRRQQLLAQQQRRARRESPSGSHRCCSGPC